jgi:sugar porter (SP) family MFS transporter
MDNDVAGRSGYVYLLTFVAALGGLLFGYDTGVISGTIGFMQTRFALDSTQTGWAASSALVGCILGAALAGSLSDRFGRRRILIVSAVLFLVSAITSALPRNLTELAIARILGGIGVGMASMLSPLYISEIAPAGIRGRLVSLNQLAIVSGFLVVYFVNAWIQAAGDESWNVALGWRLMFASGSIPAVLFFALLFSVPESPRWLVKQGRAEEALDMLVSVGGRIHAERELREIREAVAHEGGSIWQVFQPGIRVAMIIAIVLAVFQQITGINSILYYGPEIFKDAGAGTHAAFMQTVLVGVVNVGFTFVAIFSVDKLGRKALLVFGALSMGLFIFLTALSFQFGLSGAWTLLFVLCYIGSFAVSLGPVVWVYVSELFPTRIRGRAMAVATLCLWCACYLVSQTFPDLVERLGRPVPFYIYGAMCMIMALFVWLVVPETKGRTLEEIERNWLKTA